MEGSNSQQQRSISPEKGKTWVQFSENEAENSQNVNGKNEDDNVNPAVIEPSIEIHGGNNSLPTSPIKNLQTIHHSGNLQTVELHNSLENNASAGTSGLSVGNNSTGSTSTNGNRRNNTSGFTNGDVIVTILPVNTRWPWVTPASFRPELVPEELMAPGLTLTVEDYVHAMELLTSDVRFNAYTICYKRLLASWLSAAFFILLIILFSGVAGIHLFALGISWLIVNAAAVFFCMYLKIKINQGLERCMGRVNKMFLKHKLIVGLDDRGRISCHKVHLCFIYFDPVECIKRLEQVLEGAEDRQRIQNHLDVQDVEIVITGAQNTTRIPQKQFYNLCLEIIPQNELLFLRYINRWTKNFLRELAPAKTLLHCPKQQCPCQFIQEILLEKRTGLTGCCSICGDMSQTFPNTLIV